MINLINRYIDQRFQDGREDAKGMPHNSRSGKLVEINVYVFIVRGFPLTTIMLNTKSRESTVAQKRYTKIVSW